MDQSAIPLVIVIVVLTLLLQAILVALIKMGRPAEAPTNNYHVGSSTYLASIVATHASTCCFLLIAIGYGSSIM